MIKHTSSKQVSLYDFLVPSGKRLNPNNRWVKLSSIIPWDDLAKVYIEKMSCRLGRKGVDARIVIGALIIKHLKSLSDEETIEEIRENPYLQYFLGIPEYTYDQVFTPSLFVTIRRRLGEKEFSQLINMIIDSTEAVMAVQASSKKNNSKTEDNDHDSDNKGHLIVDATVAPADIKYPTDHDLLNQSREKSEQLIDALHKPGSGKVKPRTYRKQARVEYLSVAKRRKKGKKILRRAIGKQLRYLRRNLSTIEKMLDERKSAGFPLSFKEQRNYWIIQEVYRQQKEMYDDKTHTVQGRIVSLSQPHVRPIVRGKSGREVEFGAKLSMSYVDGLCSLHTVSWDAYNESTDLKDQIEAYYERYGFYPAHVSGDQIYGTRENRRYMKSKGIHFTGVELGRPKQLTEEMKALSKEKCKRRNERVKIEGKFGEGKRKYQLDRVLAKRSDTSVSWIASVVFVMNIARLMRVIFLSLIKQLRNWFKIVHNRMIFEIKGKKQDIIIRFS